MDSSFSTLNEGSSLVKFVFLLLFDLLLLLYFSTSTAIYICARDLIIHTGICLSLYTVKRPPPWAQGQTVRHQEIVACREITVSKKKNREATSFFLFFFFGCILLLLSSFERAHRQRHDAKRRACSRWRRIHFHLIYTHTHTTNRRQMLHERG